MLFEELYSWVWAVSLIVGTWEKRTEGGGRSMVNGRQGNKEI